MNDSGMLLILGLLAGENSHSHECSPHTGDNEEHDNVGNFLQ